MPRIGVPPATAFAASARTRLDLKRHPRRVARTGRQHHEVRSLGGDVRRRRVRRQPDHLDPPSAERGQERSLDAVVDEDRPSAPLPVGSDPERLAGSDRGDMVDRLPGRTDPRAFDGFGLAEIGGHDRRAAGRAIAQQQGQRSRVDARDRRDAALGEQLIERHARARRWLDEAGDDQAARVDRSRLELGARRSGSSRPSGASGRPSGRRRRGRSGSRPTRSQRS